MVGSRTKRRRAYEYSSGEQARKRRAGGWDLTTARPRVEPTPPPAIPEQRQERQRSVPQRSVTQQAGSAQVVPTVVEQADEPRRERQETGDREQAQREAPQSQEMLRRERRRRRKMRRERQESAGGNEREESYEYAVQLAVDDYFAGDVRRGEVSLTDTAVPLVVRLSVLDRDFDENDYDLLLSLDETVNRAASSTTIAALAPFTATRRHAKKLDPCVICLSPVAIGDSLKQLPCKHAFHASCLDTWLSQYNKTCPLCKYEVQE